MEELTPITRREVFLAKAAGQNVETPTPVTREEVFLDEIAKGGGSSLPAVTPSDNGKVLGVVNGAWAAQQKKFIVTLTPTAQDFSGTMDKTVSEINAAYEAGQEIVFRVYAAAGTYNEVDCTIRYKAGDHPYPSFNAYLVDSTNNVFIFAYTGTTDDGTKQTYSTTIYSLTPAG